MSIADRNRIDELEKRVAKLEQTIAEMYALASQTIAAERDAQHLKNVAPARKVRRG